MKQETMALVFTMAIAIMLTAWALDAEGYEFYHDPGQNGKGYCADCHSGFTGGYSDKLHALHTGSPDPMTNNCDLCHTGSGKGNPLIMWSGSSNGNGRGCTGCHGRDYGEKISANYGGFPTKGKAMASGYGLRKFHKNKGVNQCTNCHTDVNQSFIMPEHVNPPYYARPDVSLGGMPMYSADHEDTANDGNTRGLDNDGDQLYDADDIDCCLTVDTHLVSESAGGSVKFDLHAGPVNAFRSYYMLGSVTGTEPGTPLPGGTVILPLNWDIFTNVVVSLINTPIFQSFSGNLDGGGLGNASLNLGPVPGATGLTLYFAFALDKPWDFASNPTGIHVVP